MQRDSGALISKLIKMGKKTLCRFSCGKIRVYDLYFFLIQLVGFKITALIYELTLEGGDLKFMLDNLPFLGAMLVCSVLLAFVLTAVGLLSLQKVNCIVKSVVLVTGWIIFMNTALSDQSTTLQKHGHYNICVFFLLIILLSICLTVIKLIFYLARVLTCKKFLPLSFGTLLVAYCIWQHSSQIAIQRWNKGLSGDFLVYEWDKCNIELTGTPWIDIFPHRFFNFFVGSDSCPYVEQFSRLSPDGQLIIDCEEETALVVENPDFLSAHTDEFILRETGIQPQAQLLAKARERRYHVKGKSKIPVKSETVQVFCGEKENYHVRNIPNNTTEPVHLSSENVERVNFLMFQIDTLSRAHFIRKLEQTVSMLETLNSTGLYDVYQFFRVVTIGFNTENNSKALYTGSQFRQSRAGRPIWDVFHSQGNKMMYLNGFCEDWANRFLKRHQWGVDHYIYEPWCHPEYTPVNTTFSNFNGVNAVRRRCIVGKHVHERVFEYIREYWNNYPNSGKGILVPMQEAHEATSEVIRTIDSDLASLLEYLHIKGELIKTVVILASDHGAHMSLYANLSPAGWLEHKMPGLFVIMPKWLMEKYPNIKSGLLDAKQRAISHYDTYWTIRDLMSLPEFGGDKLKPDNFTHVWDCKKNEKYMKDIWWFKDKKFYNSDGIDNFDKYLKLAMLKLELCIETYPDPEPLNYPMKRFIEVWENKFLGTKKTINILKEQIPPCRKGCIDVDVSTVIEDFDSYIWLLDSIQDLILEQRRNITDLQTYTTRTEDTDQESSLEKESREEFRGKSGRYKFGRSILRYSDDRDCNMLGSDTCPCS
jgi:hypothetical protein